MLLGGRGISARSDSDSGIEAGDTNSCDGKIKQVTEMLSQEDHDSDDDIATDGDQGKRYQKLWWQDKESLGHKQLLNLIMMIMTWMIIMMI